MADANSLCQRCQHLSNVSSTLCSVCRAESAERAVALLKSTAGDDCYRSARTARELAEETHTGVAALGATVEQITQVVQTGLTSKVAQLPPPTPPDYDLLLRSEWFDLDLDRAIQRPAGSRVVIWGYSPLEDPELHRLFHSTSSAREFATECGWDAERPGAWAREFRSHRGLHETVVEVEPLVREDPAVAGWGGRILRDPAVPCSHRLSQQPLAEQDSLQDRSAQWADRLRALVTEAKSQRDEMRQRLQEARQLQAKLQRQLTELRRGATGVVPGTAVKAGPSASRDGRATSEPLHDPALRSGISKDAFEALNRIVSQALSLAESGRLADGYALLLEGRRRAAERSSWDASWGSEVVGVYALALENYAARFGVRME